MNRQQVINKLAADIKRSESSLKGIVKNREDNKITLASMVINIFRHSTAIDFYSRIVILLNDNWPINLIRQRIDEIILDSRKMDKTSLGHHHLEIVWECARVTRSYLRVLEE